MTKKRSWTELSLDRITFALAGLLACAISLADIFGILDIPLLQARFAQLTLLATGLVLTILATTYNSYLQENRRKITEIESEIQDDAKKVTMALQSLEHQLKQSLLEQLPLMVEDLNPALLRIFRPYLEGVFRTPPQVMASKRFRLESLESYRSYHRRALEVNPGATFFATSLASRKWFWRSDYIDRAMENFIEQGGSIVRIFFVQGEDVLDSLETQTVLAEQERLGVVVYYLDASRVPPDQRKFFLVDKNATFAWEAVRGPDDQVVSLEVTADPQEVESYIQKFDQLLKASVRYHAGKFVSRQIGGSEGDIPVNYSKEPQAFREFELLGWESAVEQYHHGWGELTSQTIEPLLDALEADATTRLLDVASGPGYVSEAATARGSSVVGLDFSDNMVKKARALHPGLEFRVGDAQDLPFEDATFDAVSMNFGMLHLANPEQAMKEALRVLRPAGRLAFTVWAPPEEALGFRIILQAVEKYGVSVTVPHGPDFFFYSRPEECKIALTTIGFLGPKVMLVDLCWRLKSSQDFFPAFYAGTARTGGLLRRQSPDARRRIEEEARRTLQAYSAADGSIEIPMPAVLAWAVKA